MAPLLGKRRGEATGCHDREEIRVVAASVGH